MVRTPGFHPGNRGFDSHRDHHVEFEKYPVRDTFWLSIDFFDDMCYNVNIGGVLPGRPVDPGGARRSHWPQHELARYFVLSCGNIRQILRKEGSALLKKYKYLHPNCM